MATIVRKRTRVRIQRQSRHTFQAGLAEAADLSRTDTAFHPRPGAWYRRRLARHFDQVGAGLWAARRAGIVLWELEGAGP